MGSEGLLESLCLEISFTLEILDKSDRFQTLFLLLLFKKSTNFTICKCCKIAEWQTVFCGVLSWSTVFAQACLSKYVEYIQ